MFFYSQTFIFFSLSAQLNQIVMSLLRFLSLSILFFGTIIAWRIDLTTGGSSATVGPTPSVPHVHVQLVRLSGFSIMFTTAIFSQLFQHSVPGLIRPLDSNDKKHVALIFGCALVTTASIYISTGLLIFYLIIYLSIYYVTISYYFLTPLETSPDNLRGRLVSLKEAAIVLGIVLGYLGGSLFGGDMVSGWRNVYLSAIPLEVLMLCGAFYLIPESARWLALRGRIQEAETVFQNLLGISKAEAKIKVLEMTSLSQPFFSTKDNSSDITSSQSDFLTKLNEIFQNRYNKQALIIGVGLVLFQQLSGTLCYHILVLALT
jgi:hypothetical protein